MLCKTLLVALSVVTSVCAHAAISPVLGVAGTPVRSDVQRPTNAKPCGRTNVADNIDTTTPIQANADGTFSTNITNFNRGVDGSRNIKDVKVDPTGTGDRQNFVAATMVQNGELAPQSDSTEQLTVQMPTGMACTGGAAGNLCLVSFTTAGRFGNCVVVQQSGSSTTNATASATTSDTTGSAESTNSTATATDGADVSGGTTATGSSDTSVATQSAGATTATSGSTAAGADAVDTGSPGSASGDAKGTDSATVEKANGIGSPAARAGQFAKAARNGV